MLGDLALFGDRPMLKPLRPLVVLFAATLGGCASASGLGDLSLIGGGQTSGETAPASEEQLAAAGPQEMPPVPTRRPGKRPPSPATASLAAAEQPAQESKSEEAGLSLASLGQINLFSATEGPDAILIDKVPIDAYSLLAQRVKYCWLNPTSPRLPNHGFHADLAPGETKEAKMVVYEKDPEGRRGISAFKIDITAESSGSLVSARNVRLDSPTEASFKADLSRWAKGDDRCKV